MFSKPPQGLVLDLMRLKGLQKGRVSLQIEPRDDGLGPQVYLLASSCDSPSCWRHARLLTWNSSSEMRRGDGFGCLSGLR